MPITHPLRDASSTAITEAAPSGHSSVTVESAKSPLCVVGLSHHTAPVELRSAVAITSGEARTWLGLARARGLAECMMLSTCNRTEIYFSAGGPEIAIGLLAERCGLSPEELHPHLYVKHCTHAADHLFRVTAGLDSAVLGESEIVAQVKAAWRLAEEEGTTGPLVDLLVRRSLEAGKRVRHETDLCRNVTSVASLAVRMVSSRLGSLGGRSVILVGAGRIARRIARELEAARANRVTVVSRTFRNAAALATDYGGSVANLSELQGLLMEADAVITAVDAPHPIFGAETLELVQAARGGKPLLVIDMGVPPNVGRINAPGIEIIDIDCLAATCGSNSALRSATIPAANAILEEELARFNEALTVQAAVPMIRALVGRAEAIRDRNVAWARERLPGLSERELRVVEELARRMMNGMLQTPIEGLKGELSGEHREVAVRLFGLDEVRGDAC